MQKRIIGFRVVDNKYTAEIIRDRILNIVKEYGIANHIISITLDNTTANTKTIKLLSNLVSSYTRGFLLHQRCACHIINIIIKSGMDVISVYIENIRSAIAYIHASNPRIAEFKRYCIAQRLKPRKF
ncbi:Ribonuclease H-like domain containing protein [Parasponia andersonii]|uniref:Ribonuclease H-like domain containing protein n=1 Tax=Parasponia andersonii TaxID=3476 RepID=A0A2P5BF43_PARAD|nr:Ribonuclease H-like domain containing protein [Parasponia andersonii]